MPLEPRVLAVIPARAGSKRLPEKNLAELAGRPLIAWTISAALEAGFVHTVMVSTESEQIAEVSRREGAEVPFLRPAELATDSASSVDVVMHALTAYQQRGLVFNYVLLLQPTSPLRTAHDIHAAWQLLREKDADAVVSVCEMEHSPLWSNQLPDDGSLTGFLRPEVLGKRSQDLPVYYRLNGALYLVSVSRFLQERRFMLDQGAYALIMPRERSVDIDTSLDLKFASLLLRERLGG
jgi:CMP-N-acetylneuraminic acid synthetase